MKAIDYLKTHKLSDHVGNNKEWYDEYQKNIIDLYSSIEKYEQSKDVVDLKLVYSIIKHFESAHHTADIKFSSLGDFNKYNDRQLFLKNPSENDLASAEYVEMELNGIKRAFEKDIETDRDYLANYLEDFNTYMTNHSLLTRLEDKVNHN
jgi:hypothetical protein